MKFDSVLIVTYGRSGSTLLQGILNSIDDYLIRGENGGFCHGLFKSYQSLLIADSIPGKHNKPSAAWYGAKSLDKEAFLLNSQQLLKHFLLGEQNHTPEKIRCYGFKEIRYSGIRSQVLDYINVEYQLDAYLDFLAKIFPNVAFIFNTRNLADVSRSAWWSEMDQSIVETALSSLESRFKTYQVQHPDNTYAITYEDIIHKTAQLEGLFAFLDEPYSESAIDQVLSVPHSYKPKPGSSMTENSPAQSNGGMP